MSNSFVSDPHAVVKSGQVVRVKVLEVEPERKRISLTLRLDDEAGTGVGERMGKVDAGSRTSGRPSPKGGGADSHGRGQGSNPGRGQGSGRGSNPGSNPAAGQGRQQGGNPGGQGPRGAGAPGRPNAAAPSASTAMAEALRRAGLGK